MAWAPWQSEQRGASIPVCFFPGNFEAQIGQFLAHLDLMEKLGRFLAEEHALAVITPSRDGSNNGGSGGTMFDDSGAALGWYIYQRDHAMQLPVAAMAIENYGRLYRLVKAHVPVSV